MVALECRPKETTNNMLWEESECTLSDSLYEDDYKITDTKGCYMDEKITREEYCESDDDESDFKGPRLYCHL